MKQHFLKKKVRGRKNLEMWIWVEPRKFYSRIIIFITKGAITEEYFTPIHSAITKYAKEQRKKHGYKEEIQCQRGVITPRFIEMFTMLGDEQQMVNEILEILFSKPLSLFLFCLTDGG